MHALHSLAHRAPPATRTRVRWQPYNSIPSSSCTSNTSRSPSITYPNTPSSVTSSPPVITPSVEFDRIRQTMSSSTLQTPKDSTALRNKYAIGLVDQAVKSLCEIWRPQDIPSVFVSSPRAMAVVGSNYEANPIAEHKSPLRRHTTRNTQLPSPISPSTQPSPVHSSSPTPSSSASIQRCIRPEQDTTISSRENLVPIKGFVHEVLRRSRTSGCVLQTALCYLEAIRSKVPELVRQEKMGVGTKGEQELGDRITCATDAELAHESDFNMCLDSIVDARKCVEDEDSMDTVRVYDNGPDDIRECTNAPTAPEECASTSNPAVVSTPSLPPLPSPLLCPRRAFLAALILASKFTQDKCYSNRAWAKLSGLPPREIGRCERALGEALEWRLWVGKLPTPQTPSPPANRPITRTQSESSIITSTSHSSFLVQNEKNTISPTNRNGLRRCTTLPAEAYSTPAGNLPLSDGHFALTSQFMPDYTSCIKSAPSTSTSGSVYQYTDKITQSPIPETPGLTYSPSSTESSSGDRTIQMSTFLDDGMNLSVTAINSESWSWLDNSDGTVCHARISPPSNTGASKLGHSGRMLSAVEHCALNPLSYSDPWVAENGISLMCPYGSHQ